MLEVPVTREEATIERHPAIGDRRPATGDRRPATGDRPDAATGDDSDTISVPHIVTADEVTRA